MSVSEAIGRFFPFARWSVLRFAVGIPHVMKEGHVGDGREQRLLAYVRANARRGDIDDVIRFIDRFGYGESWLMNVGDEKGQVLDDAITRAKPKRLLELGTYCGYSALRTVRAMPPGAHLYSIEFSEKNAAIAQGTLEHAGVADRVTIIHGTLGDGGRTVATLREAYGFERETLDFAFIDHDKNAYLPDLELILRERWLRPGAVVLADNVKFPGAPAYHAFMKDNEGTLFRTREYAQRVEYQTLIKDIVLESEFLGASKKDQT